MTLDEKQRLRARHSCVREASSMGCDACRNGVPYPALTIAEIEATMRRRERPHQRRR